MTELLVALLVVGICLFSAQSLMAQAAGSFYEQGVAAFRAAQYPPAESLLEQAESAAPTTTDALLYLAKAQIHLEKLTASEQALQKFVEAHPHSAEAFYLLGFVQNRLNRPTESLANYTRAATLAPPAGDDLKMVGLDYVLLNDYPDASHWLEKAVQMDANNRDAWYYLGRAYYNQTRLGDAKRAFLRVLALDPHESRAENNLGLVYEADAQPEAAMQAYRNAAAWQAEAKLLSEQPDLNLGNLLMAQGRTAEAVVPLRQAVAFAPESALCRLALGTAYLRLEQLGDAERELAKAVALAPANATAHYQLGKVYRKQGRGDLAKAEFDSTARLQSGAARPEDTPAQH